VGHLFGVIYANDIALEDMNAQPRLNFRTGAIIVREKLSKPDSPPKLLAAMIKREPGFNPVANDWEFLVLNGPATKIRNRSKKGACFECHKSQHDFVYGNYEQK
jgi:Cytochrome P460